MRGGDQPRAFTTGNAEHVMVCEHQIAVGQPDPIASSGGRWPQAFNGLLPAHRVNDQRGRRRIRTRKVPIAVVLISWPKHPCSSTARAQDLKCRLERSNAASPSPGQQFGRADQISYTRWPCFFPRLPHRTASGAPPSRR